MKKAIIALVCLVILLGGYAAAGPYMTLSAIKTGLVEQDTEKLTENIDFPVLRENLREQFMAAALKKSGKELEGNPFAGLAAGFAAKMVDGLLDTIVTPAGLASLMEGKKSQEEEADGPVDRDKIFEDAQLGYDSLDTFSVRVPNKEGGELQLILKRQGLSWKLVNVVIQMDEAGK